MAKKLKNLEISKVDVVDRGANQRAHMKLLKRDAAFPGILALLEKYVPSIAKALADDDSGRAERGGLTAEDERLLAEMIKRVGADAVLAYVGAFDGEKGGDAREENDADAEDKELAKRYVWLGKEPGALAAALKKARGAGTAEYDVLVARLEEEMAAVSGLFAEIGKRGGVQMEAADPWARIDRAARDRMRENASISKAVAIDEVCAAHPDWVNEYERSRAEGR